MWRSEIPLLSMIHCVRRLDADGSEVVIRHHVRREAASRTSDCGDWSLHTISAAALIAGAAASSRSPIWSFIPVSTARTRDLDRVLDRVWRGVAMTNNADASHSKERRAAVFAGIEPLERGPYVFGVDARVLTQKAHDHGSHGLVELEHDVTHESVADDDIERAAVARTRRKIAAFEIAVEVEARLLEKSIRLLDHRVSLLRLFANGQESNGGIRTTINALRVNRAKPRELQQLSGVSSLRWLPNRER